MFGGCLPRVRAGPATTIEGAATLRADAAIDHGAALEQRSQYHSPPRCGALVHPTTTICEKTGRQATARWFEGSARRQSGDARAPWPVRKRSQDHDSWVMLANGDSPHPEDVM